jgi:small subunit ribosomal protein S9
MADETNPETPEEQAPEAATEVNAEQPEEQPAAVADEAPAEAESAPAEEQPAEPVVAEPVAAQEAPAEEAPADAAEAPVAAEPVEDDEDEEPAPREKPAVPGAHLEVDIVPEGVDPLGRSDRSDEYVDPYALESDEDEVQEGAEEQDETLTQPIATVAIDLASGARYRATGKRKTAIARVTLRPGTGTYLVNGRTLEEHFPRITLQRNIRQPLETVGFQERMDVVARLHGGGISAQAGALRHGVSRALLEADPNLRGELKRRGFLTRDSRAKERKKAGLKKARKRPQFSKR